MGIKIFQIRRIILLSIFIIAILIRKYNDPNLPFHYDPGKNIVYSRAILDSFPLFPQYNPYFNLGEYYDYQVLFPYMVAVLHKITGFSLVDLTSWSIITIGSLMVITIYLLSLEIFDNILAGLISAFLISISKIQLFSYMNYYPQITALMLSPISFIFLIRYIRTTNRKYLAYTSILFGAIILSSYLVGIVYLFLLIASLIIYSIIKKEFRYINTLITILIGTLALITFYVLPIINRYGIKQFIIGMTGAIFIQKDIPFTNANFLQNDITILKTFGSLIIITLIISISLILYLNKLEKFKVNIDKIKYEYVLLSVWILVSLILIESYRFRPLLWVDRYIELLEIPIIIIAGYSIYFIINKLTNDLRINKKIILILILIIVFIYPTYDIVRHNYRFAHWDTSSDLKALEYVQKNISSESLFVAPSGITTFWVSALGGIHMLGGESSQILGERFDGNGYSDTIINSPNVEEKMNLIRKFGVQYIYLTVRIGYPSLWRNDYNLEGLKAFDDKRYFEPIYRTRDRFTTVYIIKVKDDFKPKYNRPNIDKKMTILGYVISLVTLTVMIIMSYSIYPKKGNEI